MNVYVLNKSWLISRHIYIYNLYLHYLYYLFFSLSVAIYSLYYLYYLFYLLKRIYNCIYIFYCVHEYLFFLFFIFLFLILLLFFLSQPFFFAQWVSLFVGKRVWCPYCFITNLLLPQVSGWWPNKRSYNTWDQSILI